MPLECVSVASVGVAGGGVPGVAVAGVAPRLPAFVPSGVPETARAGLSLVSGVARERAAASCSGDGSFRVLVPALGGAWQREGGTGGGGLTR